MKIWHGFGSEHSANLVMIGRFQDHAAAENAKRAIDEITELMASSDDHQGPTDRYSDAAFALLQKLHIYSVSPSELEQFRFDIRSELKDDQILVTTDETDVSAFLKLMIDNGARIEVYSAHDYPETHKSKSPPN